MSPGDHWFLVDHYIVRLFLLARIDNGDDLLFSEEYGPSIELKIAVNSLHQLGHPLWISVRIREDILSGFNDGRYIQI
jgi:hypothetical protein